MDSGTVVVFINYAIDRVMKCSAGEEHSCQNTRCLERWFISFKIPRVDVRLMVRVEAMILQATTLAFAASFRYPELARLNLPLQCQYHSTQDERSALL